MKLQMESHLPGLYEVPSIMQTHGVVVVVNNEVVDEAVVGVCWAVIVLVA